MWKIRGGFRGKTPDQPHTYAQKKEMQRFPAAFP
jgi:hypothetical protein